MLTFSNINVCSFTADVDKKNEVKLDGSNR